MTKKKSLTHLAYWYFLLNLICAIWVLYRLETVPPFFVCDMNSSRGGYVAQWLKMIIGQVRLPEFESQNPCKGKRKNQLHKAVLKHTTHTQRYTHRD